jgi:diguanylate cyclase (GGDEF)-like protein
VNRRIFSAKVMDYISARTVDEQGPAAEFETKSPFTIIWLFAAIVLGLLLLSIFSLGSLSAARAYVGGESLWSKAQKDAVFHLQKYAATGSSAEFEQYRAAIAIPLGDHAARLAMDDPRGDPAIIREGFRRGGIHPDDIDGLVLLYHRFKSTSFMSRAINAWTQGDVLIARLDEAAAHLRREVESPSSDSGRIKSDLDDVARINDELTPLENEFVAALGDASRTTYQLLRGMLLAATPVLLLFGTVLSVRILRHRKRLQDQIKQMAFFDSLTTLPNRTLLYQRLEHAITRRRDDGHQLAVLFMDLDRFKIINDSLGHAAGDVLLRQVGERLRKQVRDGDTVSRMGGDEFVVLVENFEHISAVSRLAGQLVGQVSTPYLLEDKDCHVTASIGISIFPVDGKDSQSLVKMADIAMYRAKDLGRNNYQYYSPSMNVHTLERLEFESDLRHALERDELVLHYQPKLDILSGRITGTEALLRWNHPRHGLVAPNDFIPLAEETGLIGPIGEWVFATACARNKGWQRRGFSNLTIAVNLSARQFADPQLLSKLSRIIQSSGMDTSTLELEITESMVMAHGASAVEVLEALKATGVHITIDDFGTGYSSLAYLKRLPIDSIKIDRSFIRDIPGDSGGAKITRAVIALAHSLKLQVIAEGVETEAQLAFLRSLHCDEFQGFYLYRPLPESEMDAVLTRNRLQTPAAADERGRLAFSDTI